MTHSPREYEKACYSHNEAFWREKGRLSNRFKNDLRAQKKETGLVFMMTRE